VHLLDYQGNLYDKQLEVRFVRHLRSEKKFPTLDALRAQISQDCALAHAILAEV
jgi:riboflavin kinase / FMN adenylyltransferase